MQPAMEGAHAPRNEEAIAILIAVEGAFNLGMSARDCACGVYATYEPADPLLLAEPLWSIYTLLDPAQLLAILTEIYGENVNTKQACDAVTGVWHDLMLRNALDDTGKIPYPGDNIAGSPDVWPAGSKPLADPGLLRDNWMSLSPFTVHSGTGVMNYIYVRASSLFPGATPWRSDNGRRVENKVSLYWSKASLLLNPDVWARQMIPTESGQPAAVFLPAQNEGDRLVAAEPFVWVVPADPGSDHYCFIALVHTFGHPNEPPTFKTMGDFVTYVKCNPNVGWRNVAVVYLGNGAAQRKAEAVAAARGLADPVYEFDLDLENPERDRVTFGLRLAATALPDGSTVQVECPQHPGFDIGPASVERPRQMWSSSAAVPGHERAVVQVRVTIRDRQKIRLAAGLSVTSFVEARDGTPLYDLGTDPVRLGLSAEKMGFAAGSRTAYVGNYEVRFVPGDDRNDVTDT